MAHPNPIAIEELKILQSIIARQDDFKARAKGLAITLLSAITVASFSSVLPLSGLQYVLAAIGICVSFAVLESTYGITEINAENRVRMVEVYLADETRADYDGPKLTSSLIRPVEYKIFLKAIRRWRTMTFYLMLAGLSIVGTLFIAPKMQQRDGATRKSAAATEDRTRQFIAGEFARNHELQSRLLELSSTVNNLATQHLNQPINDSQFEKASPTRTKK